MIGEKRSLRDGVSSTEPFLYLPSTARGHSINVERAGSCPAPSRGVGWPRNEGSILQCEVSVCAPEQYVLWSTKKAPNFLESRQGGVRRMHFLGTSVNKGLGVSQHARREQGDAGSA